MTGDHSHVFWDCPVLQGCWQDIKEKSEKIMNTTPIAPMLFVLGVPRRNAMGNKQGVNCVL